MRRAAKLDANQAAVVALLRAHGCSVQSLASVGGGVPDLLVGFRGVNVVIEVKDGEKAASARALTREQVAWHRGWAGQAAVVLGPVQAWDVVRLVSSKVVPF